MDESESLKTWPKNWHEAVAGTREALPWRTEEGALVLGATFPTAARPLNEPPVVPPLPDFTGLATPAVSNPTQSPEQQRGEYVHAALQGIRVAAPAAAAAEAAALAQAVRQAHPWLFSPGSRAEVTVILPEGTVGRIDRLVPHAGALWVIDFKTGAAQDPIPAAYAQQLRGYMAAVRASYPETPVRAALVWVETATLAELPETE